MLIRNCRSYWVTGCTTVVHCNVNFTIERLCINIAMHLLQNTLRRNSDFTFLIIKLKIELLKHIVSIKQIKDNITICLHGSRSSNPFLWFGTKILLRLLIIICQRYGHYSRTRIKIKIMNYPFTEFFSGSTFQIVVEAKREDLIGKQNLALIQTALGTIK